MRQIPVCSHAPFTGYVGIARSTITPPCGIYNRSWGAARHDTAAGFHRELTCTALTLQSARESIPCVLVTLDLGWWKNPEDERHVRHGLIEDLQIDEAQVVVALSHTHAGPSIARQESSKPGGHLIAGYLDLVRNTAISCARRALAQARESTLSWEYGRCTLACNRDLPDPDPERHRVVCGYNPALPADDTLLLGRVTDCDGKILATIVNYACHPTTLAWQNELISPDWVGAMRDTVEAATDGAPCLFIQGASGDLAPRRQYVGETAIADANGRIVGHAALATLSSMLDSGKQFEYAGNKESGTTVGIWSDTVAPINRNLAASILKVEIELKQMLSLAELETQLANCTDRIRSERLHRACSVRRLVGDGAFTSVPLTIWRIGGANLVALAHEAYSFFQIELRKKLAPNPIIVAGLANGAAGGYLPPRELYSQDIYQVWQTPFAAGSLESLSHAASKFLLAENAKDAAVTRGHT
jgi:hypothetical protein